MSTKTTIRKIKDFFRFSAPNQGSDATSHFAQEPIDKTLVLESTVDVRAADGAAAKLPTFSITAYNGGPMSTDYSYYPVVIELSGLQSPSSIPVLLDHDATRPVGMADKVTIDGSVSVSGTITGTDADSLKVVQHAKNGFKWQASVGVRVLRREFVEQGATVEVNGSEVTGPIVVARESQLKEVSFVVLGADSSTVATVAAKEREGHGMSLESSQVSGQGSGGDVKAGDNLPVGHTPIADVIKELRELKASISNGIREEVKAEQTRVQKIRAVCGSAHREIEAKAISEGWDGDRTELEVLRASHRSPIGVPFIHSKGEVAVSSRQVLECGLMQALKLSSTETDYKDEVLQAAHEAYQGRLSFGELLLQAAQENGYRGRHFREENQDLMRAAMSNVDLTEILSNVANKVLLASFSSVEETWRRVGAVGRVNDFKETKSLRVLLSGAMQELGPDGELKTVGLAEEGFSNQARTVGGITWIDRQDIRNDNLKALEVIPQQFGRSSALTINKRFWTEFQDDAAFFVDAGNKNLLTGAGSAFSLDGLKAASTAFHTRRDRNGDPIDVEAFYLLVSAALYEEALQLTKSFTVQVAGSANKTIGTTNAFAGRYELEKSKYLTSATGWYLLANPKDVPVIETVFLDGKDIPTVELVSQSADRLGIGYRGYIDFGVKKQDHRGGVKCAGA